MLRYNVTQKILEELSDAEARAILFSSIKEERSAAELSELLHIPLSSVYKKLARLEWLTLITVTRTTMDFNKKRAKVYKSRISKANITIASPEPNTTLIPNKPTVVDEEPPTTQQNKFDVTQLIIKELNNDHSRSVLFSVRDEAKNSRTIALEQQLPLHTVSDTLARLEYLGLAEKYTINGKYTGKYKSRIAEASITIKDHEPLLALVEN